MVGTEIYYQNLQEKYSRRINLDRKRILKVLNKLRFPHLKLNNPINVIGSDGKYTTSINLISFFEASKKNTTFFSSPHLVNLIHRYRLKKKFISLDQIKKYERVIYNTGLKLTLFEALTMIYLLAANDQKNIDYNICEAGAGFEKDSTNLWDEPKAQIITNINLQHQDLFGVKTLKEVIKIKVGYLSKKTNIYIGKQTPKVLNEIKRILKNNPSKVIYPSNWRIIKNKGQYFYKDKKNIISIKSKYIHSKGLIDNLGLSIKIALDFKVKPSIIQKTIPKINYEGRIQYIEKGKLRNHLQKNEQLLLDGAHSKTSAKNLYDYLKETKLPLYCVWAMQKNKFPKEFLKEFKGIFKKIVTVKIPGEPNSCTADELKSIAIKQDYKVEAAIGIKEALKTISSKEKKIIVVMGSLYWCGSVLKEN